MIDFYALEKNDWINDSQKIYALLKEELQNSNGIIKKIKKNILDEKEKKISLLLDKFDMALNLNLDNEINKLCNSIQILNLQSNNELSYNFLFHLKSIHTNQYLVTHEALKFLNKNEQTSLSYKRLLLIFSKIINESIVNSNKNAAGKVIQEVVKIIFRVSELNFGQHFRENYRSLNKSEVNFVLPAVGDFDDNNVEIALACQMSSNDRIKLAINELNIGRNKFILTGNGLDANNTSLQAISNSTMNELKDKNIKLVSFREGLRQEINRVSNLSNENYLRLNYLKNFCMSFYQFSRFLSYYFKKHKGL